jgi:hypothetical protein
MSYSIVIDVDGIEVPLEVEVDGESYEAPSMECPGSPGGVWVEKAFFASTGNQVPELFFEKHSEQMDEMAAEAVEDHNNEMRLDAELSKQEAREQHYNDRYGDGPW